MYPRRVRGKAGKDMRTQDNEKVKKNKGFSFKEPLFEKL
jgi:hypothetical protein